MEILKAEGKVDYFYELLVEDIGEEAASNVLTTAHNIFAHAPKAGSNDEQVLGLLYGLIQSGKTNVINMTVAMAADHGYKLSIILTDRNNSLQKQTYDRTDEAIIGMLVRNIDELSGEDPEFIKTVMESDGIVLICKKDPADLNKLEEFLKEQDFTQFPVLIADDEADAVGLNTKQRIEGEAPSTINQQLLNIKALVDSHLYLQVTATPQAIILQNRDESGFHPEFIEVVEAGNGYSGIHTFFQENKKEHVREVDKNEVEVLADRGLEDFRELPEGLLKALSNFIMGASIKILENNGRRDEQKFSFLCHVSPFKQIHTRIQVLCKKFIQQVFFALKKPEAAEDRKFILSCLSDAYEDLRSTNENIPEFSEVFKALSENINSHEIIVLNSAKDSEKDIKLSKKFNFIIGGNKLGRGLTIPRLLVTYYGRSTASPQVDTLMQHARMCGYRSKDLSVTRVYIPDDLSGLFEEICEHDTIQRDIIKDENLEGTLYLNTDKLSPTRPLVIPKSVGAYKSGQATFLKLPIHKKGEVEPITDKINKIVGLQGNKNQILKIEIETAKNIIESILVEYSGGWHSEVISKFLTWYQEESGESTIQFIYNPDSNIGPATSRDSKGIGSVLSSSMQDLVKKTDIKVPLLVLVRTKGTKFENGTDFWIPWFRFPEINKNILFNLNNI